MIRRENSLFVSAVAAGLALVSFASPGMTQAPPSGSIYVQPSRAEVSIPEGMTEDGARIVRTIDGAGLEDASAVANGALVDGRTPKHEPDYNSIVRWFAKDFQQSNFVPGVSVVFHFDTSSKLNGVMLWNYGEFVEGAYGNHTDRGVESARFEFSSDGGLTWGSPVELTFEPSSDEETFSPQWRPFQPTGANAVKMTLLLNFGRAEANGIIGFSEIRFTSQP